MSLAFLNKKSWHTQRLDNVEKVWAAEQAQSNEKKKVDALRRERQEERNKEELQRLKRQNTGQNAKGEMVDWMYQGPVETNHEEYLLGKEYRDLAAQKEMGDLEKKETAGALFGANDKVNDLLEAESRMREDPMMAIMKKEQAQRKLVLNNPVKMKKIKDNANLLNALKKAAKQKRKLAKHNKKEKKSKKSKKSKKKKSKRKRSSDEDSDSDGDGGGDDGGRDKERSARPTGRDDGSRVAPPVGLKVSAAIASKYGLIHPNGAEAAEGLRNALSSSDSEDDDRSRARPAPTGATSRRKMIGGLQKSKRSRSRSPKRDRNRDRDRDRRDRDRDRDERDRDDRGRRDSGRERGGSKRLTAEEKKKKLEAMMSNAEKHDVDTLNRLIASRKDKDKEEKELHNRGSSNKYDKASFIKEMNKDLYNGESSLEDRMQKNKHYRQKGNMDNKSFM